MKFYLGHIQFIPSAQRKLDAAKYSGKPIELAEKLLQEHNSYSPSKQRGYTSLVFDNFILDTSDGRLLAALIGKGVLREVPKHNENGFYKAKDDQWPFVVLLWDREEQIILIEKDQSVFQNYEAVFKSIEDHFNNLFDPYELRVYIEPKTEKVSFWNAVEKFKYIYVVTFELHRPNLLGITDEQLAESIDKAKQFNGTSVSTSILNPDGGLALPRNHPIIMACLNWIANGGGSWLLKGKKSEESRPETVSSKNSDNYRSEEIPLEVETLNPTSIKSTLSKFKPRFSASTDKDDAGNGNEQSYFNGP
ncbi:MAG: hypothetical protein NC238_10035 [Dehalobacter sp.]|nr:hypothetical protein [Dehalobacter sp.]